MADIEVPTPYYMTTERRSLIATAVIGFLVGALGWALNLGVQRFFVEPIFCRNVDSFANCAQGGTISWVIAIVIVSAVGLFALVRASVFRPLLVVLATIVALWGVFGWLGPMTWWMAILWHGALFALAYALFGWIARSDRFPVAFIAIIVIILLLRLVAIRA